MCLILQFILNKLRTFYLKLMTLIIINIVNLPNVCV